MGVAWAVEEHGFFDPKSNWWSLVEVMKDRKKLIILNCRHGGIL